MEHFNLKSLIKGVADFDRTMEAFYRNDPNFYSYVGVNCAGQTVSSLKFYYVFFKPNTFQLDFPLVNLNNEFAQAYKDASKLAYENKSNGGGVTLAFKINRKGEYSFGFYLRQNGNNSPFTANITNIYPTLNLKQSDFEEGFGRYWMVNNQIKTENIYVYLKANTNLNTLEKMSGINYAQSRGIEISAANSFEINKHKFIALGGPELYGESTIKNIPIAFFDVVKKIEAKLICPAITIDNSLFTCYAYKNKCNLALIFLNELRKESSSCIHL